MKKKIYTLLLLLMLVVAAGCNKNKKQAEPTPTPVPTEAPTPTPTPVNLAKINLDKLPEKFDTLMSYQPSNNIDYTNGVGYDVSVKLSIGQQIVDLLGLTGLDNIHASGTVDIKDTLAANMSLYLNDSEIINTHIFADSTNLLYNLPKYSSNYAVTSWQEIMNSLNEESGTDSSLIGSSHDVIRTINTVDTPAFPSDEAMMKLLRKHLQDFTECFIEVSGIEKNAAIGNGSYVLSGEKHTVRADINDLYAVLTSLETELQNYGEIDFNLDEFQTEAAFFLLDYYISENGDYAWAAYPDNEAANQLVFINTSVGFCLYITQEDGTTEMVMYSTKTTEDSGIITIPSSDTAPEGTIHYELGENSISLYAILDTMELTLETSKINDTIRYNVTLVIEGFSVVIKETVTPNHTDVSLTLASYGIEYLTMSATTDTRDYVEIPIPQNTVAADIWAEELDQAALLSDLIRLMQDYPFLMNFFGGSEDSYEEDSDDFWETDDTEDFVIPEGYTDDFSSMNGYAIDSWGYVDFSPEESEVLSLGKPSTGMDTLQITENQKNALFDYAEKSFPSYETYTDTFYWVWGSIEYQDVQSYYRKTYVFYDTNNIDNYIYFEFDAVSGEFSSVEIYHENKATALRMANDILALLDIDYTVTEEIIEDYTFAENFSFSGYDAGPYGGNYYNVSISVYYPEW